MTDDAMTRAQEVIAQAEAAAKAEIEWDETRPSVRLPVRRELENSIAAAIREAEARGDRHGYRRAKGDAIKIVNQYAAYPASEPNNNTLEAFESGMNHETGSIDAAGFISSAISALAEQPQTEKGGGEHSKASEPASRRNNAQPPLLGGGDAGNDIDPYYAVPTDDLRHVYQTYLDNKQSVSNTRADRMLAALRSPSEGLMTEVIKEMCKGGINCPTAGSILRAAADFLEREVK